VQKTNDSNGEKTAFVLEATTELPVV